MNTTDNPNFHQFRQRFQRPPGKLPDPETLRKHREWSADDISFFGKGACHFLARAFLDLYPTSGFRPFVILADRNAPGLHVVVSDAVTLFDCHGYSPYNVFVERHTSEHRRHVKSWNCKVLEVIPPRIDEAFCAHYQLDQKSAFLHDPIDRARNFLQSFPAPPELG